MTKHPPRELPGFYYDPEKNRYFPIRGPIPGAAVRRRAPPPSPDPPPPATGCSRKRARRPDLLSAREMYGGGVIVSSTNRPNSTFKQQYQYAQASQPTVWKYQGTRLVADKALEQLHAMVQTPEGVRGSRILLSGSLNGSVRLYGLEGSLQNFSNEMEFSPQPAWTPLGKQDTYGINSALPSIWSSEEAFVKFPSSITCVKKFGPQYSDAAHTNSSVQRALLGHLTLCNMVATLGSGGCGGSVYVMDLSQIVDSSMGSQSTSTRNRRVASLDRTVWAADCNSDGTRAAFGMDHGAGLLDLETEAFSQLYRSKSDILSLKFVHSGNVVLCGLRNGSIVPVDVRQNHRHHPTVLPSPNTARRTVPMPPRRHNGRLRNQAAMDKCSRVIYMSSAVCSLVALSSDESYFLGSSMDGSIKLFDLRLSKKGGIQSYEGHVNSHTHLPLVIEPSETLVMSGGEDCTIRIWSIKTGELIFAQRVADTLFTSLCWPESSSEMCGSLLFDVNHSWGAWLGSRDGLYYMHGT